MIDKNPLINKKANAKDPEKCFFFEIRKKINLAATLYEILFLKDSTSKEKVRRQTKIEPIGPL